MKTHFGFWSSGLLKIIESQDNSDMPAADVPGHHLDCLDQRSLIAAKDSLLDIRNSIASWLPLKCTKLLFDTYSMSHNKMIVSQITAADANVSTSCVLLLLSWWFQSGTHKTDSEGWEFHLSASKMDSQAKPNLWVEEWSRCCTSKSVEGRPDGSRPFISHSADS